MLISGGDGLTLAPEAVRVDPPRPARDPAHRDHPHRLARAGLPAPAHRRRAVRDAREVPPAVDEPPLQPPERDHARGVAGGRQADAGRASRSATSRCCSPASTTACNIQRDLVHRLVEMRVRPYYLYQCDLVEGSGHFRTPVGKGLEIIEGLRGHTSGYAVPTYVIDAPGGGGKIPVMPNYLISYSDHKVVLRNYEGYITTYEEPLDVRAARQGELRVVPAHAPRARPVGRPRPAPGRADVDRADGLRGGPHARQRRGSTASRTRRSGCRTASARSRARRGPPLPVLAGRARRHRSDADGRVRAGRGAAAARGRADGLRPRGAALAANRARARSACNSRASQSSTPVKPLGGAVRMQLILDRIAGLGGGRPHRSRTRRSACARTRQEPASPRCPHLADERSAAERRARTVGLAQIVRPGGHDRRDVRLPRRGVHSRRLRPRS